jgi:SAM-dependent methyltransferase
MNNFYDVNYERFIKETRDIDMTHLYQCFLPHIKKNGLILDVGSGSGRDSMAFSSKGYRVIAIDNSEKMVNATQQLANVDVHLMDVLDLNFDEKFDGIWASASLLHIPRDLLVQSILTLLDHLKHDGILYMSFQCGESEREEEGRYFNDQTKESFTKLVSDIPFIQIEDIWVTPDRRPDRLGKLWLNCLVRKNMSVIE